LGTSDLILGTEKVKIRRIAVGNQPQQIGFEILSRKNPSHTKKRLKTPVLPKKKKNP
jgi:hypothetical protein